MPISVPSNPTSTSSFSLDGVVQADAFSHVTRFSPTDGLSVLVNPTDAEAEPFFLTATPTPGFVLQVNATGDGLEWAAGSGGGGSSFYQTIRDNGVAETQRAFLNVLSTTSIIVAAADDAGNTETELTWERAALTGAITAAQNSNTTSFGALAAKSVLANATNASAVPAALAGSAAFQYLRVNTSNDALEWAVLSVSSPITLTGATIGFDGTAALNNNARVGVRKNSTGSTFTRRRVNFIEGTGVTLTVGDDAVDEEVDVTINATATGLSSIPDQRVLGNDSGSAATPTAITVHQELDWIGGTVAWVFDGVDDVVSFGNVLGWERTDSHTYSFWFQTTQTTAGYIFFKQNTAANRHGPAVFIQTTGQLFINLNNNAGGSNDMSVRTNSAYNDGNLHHCVLTYGGTGGTSVNFYIDGALVAKTVLEDLLAATIVNTSPLLIGHDNAGFPFSGVLRDLAQWTVALTAGDALAIYNAGIGADYTTLGLSANPVQLIRLDSADATGAGNIIDYGTGNNDGTAGGSFAPTGVTGSLPVRGSTIWQLMPPGASGLPLVSNGISSIPSYRTISVSGLSAIAADTLLANPTGSSAVPVAHPFSTVAGAGLTYASGALAIGSSTSIAVNANDIQRAALTGAITAAVNSNTTAFGALAAKSVLANSTNASAVPAALAGSAAFQYLRVNSANTALEWAVLSLAAFPTMAAGTVLANVTAGTAVPTAHALSTLAGAGLTYTNVTGVIDVGGSTSIIVGTGDVQRAALTGAITAAQNSNTTAFGALAAKSVLANATNASAVPADLAASTASHILQVNSANTALIWSQLQNGSIAQSEIGLDKLIGGEQEVTTAGSLSDVARTLDRTNVLMFSGTGQSLNSVVSTGFPLGMPLIIHRQNGDFMDILDAGSGTATNVFAIYKDKTLRLGDDEGAVFVPLDLTPGGTNNKRWLCVSHRYPFHNSSDLIHGDQIYHDGTDWAVLNRSTSLVWWEDFDADDIFTQAVEADDSPEELLLGSSSRWFSTCPSGGGAGSLSCVAGTSNHPGNLRLTTSTSASGKIAVHKGLMSLVRSQLRRAYFNLRINTTTSVYFTAGLGDTNFAAGERIDFFFDTAVGTNIRARTTTGGIATITDTGVAPGTGFRAFEITQSTLGTIVFKIDGSTVATHTTDIPATTAPMNTTVELQNRTAASRTLDLDCVGFESHVLAR